MDKVKETLKQNTKILDPYAAMVPVIVDASAKVGVNPGLILAAVGSIVVLVLMVLQGWTILLTTVTVLYPAVHSIRAIQSPDEDDDKVWLTYWMIFGLFTTMETFFGFVFYFIPYWDWIRLAFFIWLLLPNFNGAKQLYEGVIRNLLNQHKDLIAKWISMTQAAAESAKTSAMDEAKSVAADPNLLAKGLEAHAKLQEAVKDEDDVAEVEEAQ